MSRGSLPGTYVVMKATDRPAAGGGGGASRLMEALSTWASASMAMRCHTTAVSTANVASPSHDPVPPTTRAPSNQKCAKTASSAAPRVTESAQKTRSCGCIGTEDGGSRSDWPSGAAGAGSRGAAGRARPTSVADKPGLLGSSEGPGFASGSTPAAATR
ncbi:MAG: hypothetical protein PGN11_21125 [Quadrisphaera sp.]